MPVSPIEIRFRMKKGVQFREAENTSISDYVYKRDIYSLVGNQRITRTLYLLCQKRGIYTIEDVTMVTYSLLQEKLYENSYPTDARIYVLYLPPSRKKSQRTILEQALADEWQDEQIADFEHIFEQPLEDAIPVCNNCSRRLSFLPV